MKRKRAGKKYNDDFKKTIVDLYHAGSSVKIRIRYSKKGYGHIREKVTEAELNHFIEKYKEQYSVQKMCEVLTIPRSYYNSFKKTVSNRARTGKSEADERNPTNSFEK